jgi:hypothetical protein
MISSCLYAECFPVDSLADELFLNRQLSKLIESGVNVDESCLVSIISNFKSEKKENAENLRILIDRHFSQNGVLGLPILFSGFRNSVVFKNQQLWPSIKKGWLKKNRSPQEAFSLLLNDGFPAQADTLYSIFDTDAALDKYDMVRWARVKSITGDYFKISSLLCRTLQSSEPRFIEISLMQFSEILSEMAPETIDSITQQFSDQCFPTLKLDDDTKSIVFSWVIEAWGKLNEYRKQMAFVRKSVPAKERGLLLYQISEKYFLQKNVIAAAAVASGAYQCSDDANVKKQAAVIAYQSWVVLNRNDSVAVWIERAGLDNDMSKADAVQLYQKQGDLKKSQMLLNDLPHSLCRDTLMVRQYLCSKENDSVSFELLEKSSFLKDEPILYGFWTLRLLLFYHKVEKFKAVVDSLRMIPEWSMFPELLKYRYWIQMCDGQEDMLAMWATIEYNNFIGWPQNSTELLCSEKVSGPVQSLLVMEVARTLIIKSADEAVSFFTSCKDLFSDPGVIYCKAEANLLAGRHKESEELLQSIILKYPKDVFSGKARILLMKFGKGR